MEFSNRVRALRNERSLTQKMVGQSIGVTARAVRYYELGARRPSYELLIALADCFDVSIDYLIGRTEDQRRR